MPVPFFRLDAAERPFRIGSAILTFDRRDYIRFHLANEPHAGIIACTFDADFAALAGRIHAAVIEAGTLNRKLVRVNLGGWTIEEEE